MARLVFEIGTEELPPRFLAGPSDGKRAGAVEQLRTLAEERLRAARLAFGEVKTYATPRRLALIVEGLAEKQESRIREEQGPPAPRAFNPDGTPNQAAVGFAARWGVKPEDLQVRPTPRGDYVFAVFQEEGKTSQELLREMLPALTQALYFPKMMHWGAGTLRFGRPIRWLVALLDEEVVEFELNGLRSGREARGHPTLGRMKDEGGRMKGGNGHRITIASAQDYEKALRKAKVIVDQQVRRRVLARQLRAIAKEHGARLADAKDLTEETVFLVEWPTAVCGSFAEKYLQLPRPVLMEEMRKVQGFFPLEDNDGRLVARFIGVRDGGRAHLEGIRGGYEGVLRAKFEDATYFFEHDRRIPFENRVEQLKGVVFQAGMGSLYDKAERLRRLAGYFAEALGLDEQTSGLAERAAWLAKADLVTDLVVDITSLQGVMGREYALADGEAREVADAIGEHYRPRFAGDNLPATSIGRIVALADKLDTVVSGLAAGLSVSGSEDPYGLRREAQGIASLLVEGNLHLEIGAAITYALDLLAEQQTLKIDAGTTRQTTEELLRGRLERMLKDAPPLGKGVRYDLAEAALAAGTEDLAEAAARAQALQKLSHRADFLPTVVASTRPANIAKGFEGGEPDLALFQESTERELWKACQEAAPKVEALAAQGDYSGLFSVLAGLRTIIDRFFDEVLVMAQEEQIRKNRLALVWQVARLFHHLADFRLVVQERVESQ